MLRIEKMSSPHPPSRLLHVSFSIPAGGLDDDLVQKLETVLGEAGNWMRYSRNCWIIYSRASPTRWTSRIRQLSGMEKCSVFICPFDPSDADGWLHEHQ